MSKMFSIQDLIDKVKKDPLLNEQLLRRKIQVHVNGSFYSVDSFDAVFRRESNTVLLDFTPGYNDKNVGGEGEDKGEVEEQPKIGDNKEVSEKEKGTMLSDDDILGFISNKREQIKKQNG